jgi:DNA-binding HxlR family transcriptional regulator
MGERRTYGDRCGVARGLDLIGERWALLVVRELLLGPKRFTDLRAGLPGVSADVLAQRLRDLEAAGVVARRTLPPPAASRVYELTAWGAELRPAVLALGRWGSRGPLPPDADAAFGPDALVLALESLFDPAAAGERSLAAELRLGDQRFALRVGAGRLEAARGEALDADVALQADAATLAQVLWHGLDVDEAVAAGRLVVEGSREALAHLREACPAPQPAVAATR